MAEIQAKSLSLVEREGCHVGFQLFKTFYWNFKKNKTEVCL
jgi:hypothetical protein